jgi:hypothetical protein
LPKRSLAGEEVVGKELGRIVAGEELGRGARREELLMHMCV